MADKMQKTGGVFPEFHGPVEAGMKPAVLFLDVLPSKGFLEEYLGKTPPGGELSTVFLVSSDVEPMESWLADAHVQSWRASQRLRLWEASFWEKELEKEAINLRSPLYAPIKAISDRRHPLKDPIARALQKLRRHFLVEAENSRKALLAYYQGEAFEQRKRALQRGASPRIYLERACSSVAVKRFTDQCAKALRDLQCEVKVHPPCTDGALDYLEATHREIAAFQPDLVIRSPNAFRDDEAKKLWEGPPMLYPLQDIAPHLEFTRFIQDGHLKGEDLVYLILRHFEASYLEAGAAPQQLICWDLPAEQPVISLEARAPLYEVGFAKTMGAELCLTQLLSPRSEAEARLAAQIEKQLEGKVEREEAPELSSFVAVGEQCGWGQSMIDNYHQKFCLHFIEKLDAAGFSLALTGANWECFPQLNATCLGHVEERSAYQEQFLQNRINLSMDAWAQYHPRLFEGGMCGAFFLVFRSPEGVSLHDIPDRLKPGEHFDYFTTSEELVSKCHFYLERPALTQQIGQNLREALEAHFSCASLCSDILTRFKERLT